MVSGGGAFSLVTQQWMAVLDNRGRSREVSLQQLFEEAGSFRTLSGELATQDVAVLRLCLAILQRALDDEYPERADDVPEVLERLDDEWDSTVVPAVLGYLESHASRFDLFDPFAPFFQVAGMHTTKGEFSELNKLILDMPAGKPFLTSRSATAARLITPAEAARWLVHLQAFDPSGIKTGVVGHPRANGGRVYPEGVAWTGQLGLVHLLGGTIQQTLLLNLWAVRLDPETRARDLPPWERPVAALEPTPDLLQRPTGPVDLYTWQSRRALLRGGPDGVTGVLVTYGDRFLIQERQGVTDLEPMSLWRYSKPQTAKYKYSVQMPRKHREGVALWRGLAAVVPRENMRGADEDKPTLLVEHAASLVGSGLLPDRVVRYRAVGAVYGAQESVIDEVVEDSLDLPAAVLDRQAHALRGVALDAVHAANQGVIALARLARGLATAAGAGRDEAVGPGERAFESGWSALDEPYRRWLVETLAHSVDEPLLAQGAWHRLAWQTLAGIGHTLVASAPDKAWLGFGGAGKRDDVGAVYRRFQRGLGAALPHAWPARGETYAHVGSAPAPLLTEEES